MTNESSVHVVRYALAVCLIGMLTGACSARTPLQELVQRDARGFRVKPIVRGEPELGSIVRSDGQADALICFEGTPRDEPGWAARTLEYSNALIGDVTADFDNTLRVTGSATRVSEFKIVLADTRIVRIDSLHAIGCPELVSPSAGPDRSYSVVTQAYMARSIQIGQSDTSGVTVEVDTTVIGGSLQNRSETEASWAGAELYFADLLQTIRVRITRNVEEERLRVNETIDVELCGFTLTSVDREDWSGLVSCAAGGGGIEIYGKNGEYGDVHFQGGTSVSVRVRFAELSHGLVDVLKFDVTHA